MCCFLFLIFITVANGVSLVCCVCRHCVLHAFYDALLYFVDVDIIGFTGSTKIEVLKVVEKCAKIATRFQHPLEGLITFTTVVLPS